MNERPDLSATAKTLQDGLFTLAVVCLHASHEPLDADAVSRINGFLQDHVPALHRLLGEWQVLDRLSGNIRPPQPTPTPGGDRAEADRILREATTVHRGDHPPTAA